MATKSFSELKEISPETLVVLKSLGFEKATPVQEATIPLFSGNKDVAVDASTGSGKTLAFIVPVIDRLRRLEDPLLRFQVGAIIVSPTRELAKQIASVAQPFVASVPGLSSQLLVGGTDVSSDVAALRAHGGQLLIGTPGRLHDVLTRCDALDTRRCEVLVLDEADRLLDMGFKRQLDAIMARLPRQRRTGLFSATQTEAVEALARAGLRNPVRIAVAVTATADAEAHGGEGLEVEGACGEAQKTPASLTLQYMVCELDERLNQLISFLAHNRDSKVIVYFLTCACVDFYSLALKRLAAPAAASGQRTASSSATKEEDASLARLGTAVAKALRGIVVHALHGRMKQSAREAALEEYRALPAGVLLCTDLAARGLDIPDVHWIVQFDAPANPDAFVHRVGRTARMGRAGSALAFLTAAELTYVEFLRRRGVPLAGERVLDESAADVLPLLRAEAEGDREVMEKGVRAFVSYVRGYKEHQCRFIFRLQELSAGRLARALGVLRVPRVRELKRTLLLEGFQPSAVDPDTVPYRDKAREKQRLKALAQAQKQASAAASAPQVPKVRIHTTGANNTQGNLEAPGARITAAQRRKLQQRDEDDELQEEYRMLRKLKKGKVSERQYEVTLGLAEAEASSDEEQRKPENGELEASCLSSSGDEGRGVDLPLLPKTPMEYGPRHGLKKLEKTSICMKKGSKLGAKGLATSRSTLMKSQLSTHSALAEYVSRKQRRSKKRKKKQGARQQS